MSALQTDTWAGGRALELAAEIHGLAAVVAQSRNEFDSNGRLPDHLFEQLAALGLFRLLLPASLGGPGLSALEFMGVVEAAAALDGTVGWLTGNGGVSMSSSTFDEAMPWSATGTCLSLKKATSVS